MILAQLSREGLAEINEKIRGQRGELITVLTAITFRCRTTMTLAKLDEKMQGGHLYGFVDALGQLRVDALAKSARIVRAVTEAGGPERILHHALGNRRLSPRASGSGAMWKSA